MDVWFDGLTCSSPQANRLLLEDVSGRFCSGELTAILGPSGAGKTTLLNAISGYRSAGVTGRMVEGARDSSSYIGQEDLLAPMITAGELMGFASRVKLPAATDKQRAAVVEELLSNLSLEDAFNTRTEQMSGGQRRRLSIALELINNPPVLFLDEPTSGLDTVSTGQLIRLLSRLSRGGRTIVCTIHQPSASLFDLFDRVYILALGRCVYQGGTGAHLIHYLAAHNFVCPIHHNPADFVIELLEDKRNVDALCIASKNGKTNWYSKEVDLSTLQAPSPSVHPSTAKCKKLSGDFTIEDMKNHSSFWLQFSAIFARLMLQANRNKIGLYIQIFHHISCSVIIGCLFYNCGNDGIRPFNQLKFYLTLVVFYTYTQSIISILLYPFEVKLMKREHFNKWYSLFPYFASFTAFKAFYMIPLTSMFVLVVYAFSGLPWEFERFSLFLAVAIMTSFTAEAFGLIIGTLFSVTNGSIMGPAGLAVVYGLAIYGLDFSRSINPLISIILRTSFMRAARTCLFLVGLSLGRTKLDCDISDSHCFFNDPRVFLYHLDLEHVPLWHAFGDLFLNMCLYRLIYYLVLKWKMRM